uniref:NADH dehydrogenase subunit 9 n=1 Tax=Paramoeba aparasomata TaxID=2583407 RepID=A0A5P8HBI2_9EUKA|nr:NADH dehydrogenase subunit 9 [Paramoeba aparasomata]
MNTFYSYIIIILKKFLHKVIINNYYINIVLKSYTDLNLVQHILKLHNQFQFNVLTDIACVDFLNLKNQRFAINYILSSIINRSRLIITVACNEQSLIESTTNIHSSSNWLEREVWDLFGIFFFNHTDLRRILTDYGFNGYPLRKNFPLNGYLEIRYDEEKQYLVYEPIELMQNIRYFDFLNPFYRNYVN